MLEPGPPSLLIYANTSFPRKRDPTSGLPDSHCPATRVRRAFFMSERTRKNDQPFLCQIAAGVEHERRSRRRNEDQGRASASWVIQGTGLRHDAVSRRTVVRGRLRLAA